MDILTSFPALPLITLDDKDIEMTAIRAQGPGGQNVNKVSSAIHLRFDVRASSLPEIVKERLLMQNDQRISRDGVIVIKAQQARSQEKNRADALDRLQAMILKATIIGTVRRPTRPTYGSQRRRLESKASRSQIKSMRGKVNQ